MKGTTLIFMFSLIFSQPVLANEQAELQKFFSEGHAARLAHIEKMYGLKKEQLERRYQQQKATAEQIHQLEQQIKPGQSEENQALRQQIRELRQSQRERDQSEQEAIQKAHQEFREQMRERRGGMREEFKGRSGRGEGRRQGQNRHKNKD
jgi:uncharacterized phage infection (PIP) family protein YhgE